ncbi:dienelactone hydrolase [Parafrankia colletiae]|uniref:Dienelactone hydrolase n=1 Tax=Parafrankia colletiae TaxID=573497 RepID=A0A1S1QKC3_9ACTN|nr:dienelactone hydrolase family protein [Parafrankia colletiae]MCK9901805.1 dienelactone hydrolase family protein [Frankia sp. Cpl3]OHV34036.1 dienelactone hydrolase [Parafrankia colletiae]
MRTENIEYTCRDLHLVGELSLDESRPGPRPAVLVCHGGGGLNENVRRQARRLAELGYVAFALDYYGGGRELRADETDRFAELSADMAFVRSLGRAGLEVLLAQEATAPGQVAAIGYCFGGALALELARDGADLRAIVGFHSILATPRPADAANITGRVLVCLGTDDPYVPPEQRRAFEAEMHAAGVAWEMHLYGGVGHSFTDPSHDGLRPGIRYDRRSDERSWKAMIDLFEEVFPASR